MNRNFPSLTFFCATFLVAPLAAVAVTIPTVPVGNAGNTADTTVMTTADTSGYGAVAYDYRIGTTETEKRCYPDRPEPVDCVLLDSVQSQANRMEEALQSAIDDGRLSIPLIKVDFGDVELLDEIRCITSLTAPHRIADAILRDSLLDGKPFRKSEQGSLVAAASSKDGLYP